MEKSLIDHNVTEIKGIGPKKADILKNMGIFSIRDLLCHYPKKYIDLENITSISDIVPGSTVTVKAKVVSEPETKNAGKYGKYKITTFTVSDGTEMQITYINQPFIANEIEKDKTYFIHGKTDPARLVASMSSPLIASTESERILPVYQLTEGLSQKVLRNWIRTALEIISFKDSFEEEMSLCSAYHEIHFPSTSDNIDKAKERLAKEELVCLVLGLDILKRKKEKQSPPEIVRIPEASVLSFTENLPFKLTDAQNRVISECIKDISDGTRPMNRLVQGDVGCGKTIVAEAVMYYCVKCGGQCAMMVPTGILAEQQYNTIKKDLEPFGITVELLTGKTKEKERKEVTGRLASGETNVVVGTHSLISDGVSFKHLILTITDEQHRFGTDQKNRLLGKGTGTHSIVMSATPIPETLARVIYGDMDVSVIDSVPEGRQKISTFIVNPEKRNDMYTYVRKEIEAGAQAYVVCPLVEEDPDGVMSVESFEKSFGLTYFSGIDVGYLHGKMNDSRKDIILRRFAENRYKVLVATSLIEVGINVPNATIMIIENAERFGIAQLHQIRGRVGRGDKKSLCIAVSGSESERLKYFASTNDGFGLSMTDLKMRGSGDFISNRQHGLPSIRMSSVTDSDLIDHAVITAGKIKKDTLWFKKEEYSELAGEVAYMFSPHVQDQPIHNANSTTKSI